MGKWWLLGIYCPERILGAEGFRQFSNYICWKIRKAKGFHHKKKFLLNIIIMIGNIDDSFCVPYFKLKSAEEICSSSSGAKKSKIFVLLKLFYLIISNYFQINQLNLLARIIILKSRNSSISTKLLSIFHIYMFMWKYI